MYTIDVSGNVTLYGQEQDSWCGPANAEMTRNGYPNWADRVLCKQPDLWQTIQFLNSSKPADIAQNWASDPHGLTGCLQNLANPAGLNWIECSLAQRNAILFAILSAMNDGQYPTPVLTDAGGHWVVIVGWATDVAPVKGSNPILQWIHVYDPEPVNVGAYNSFTADEWYRGPWGSPVSYPGTWLNKYVALVAAGIPAGTVNVRALKRSARSLVPPDQVTETVRRAIEEQHLGEHPKYALLLRPDSVSAEPLLVREGSGDGANVPQYYIMGFGLRGEAGDHGEVMVRVAVLVNANTGAVQEMTAFGQPVRYLTEAEARAIVARAMRVEPQQLSDAEAVLMFQHGDITHLRSYPFWRVKVGKKNVYVDQLGRLYTKLLRTPGH